MQAGTTGRNMYSEVHTHKLAKMILRKSACHTTIRLPSTCPTPQYCSFSFGKAQSFTSATYWPTESVITVNKSA